MLILFCSDAFAQIGRLKLSPFQKIEQNIARTDIVIEYSRPLKRERVIFGDLVPFGKWWRTGANQNTTIDFSEKVMIDSVEIPKGKYAIFTKPGKESWDFMLYKDTDNWDVPEVLDSSKIVCTINVPSLSTDRTAEALTISIDDFTNYNFDLSIKWDKTLVVIPIELTTKEFMDKLIDDVLNGPQGGDYYSAAVYQLESEKNYAVGLEYINKAIEIREKPRWYDFRAKALLLLEMNRNAEAKEASEQGMKLAKKISNAYGISEFERILKLSNE